jgi:hypothetical protein
MVIRTRSGSLQFSKLVRWRMGILASSLGDGVELMKILTSAMFTWS